MKKMLVMVAALVFAMALVGCAQSTQSSGSAASAASSTPAASAAASASASQATQVESDDDEDADDSDETSSSSKYISEDEAEQIAIQEAGMGSPDDVDADLVEGGDAPHYVVTLKADGVVRVVEIDAVTGEVWSNQVATPPPSNSNEDDDDALDDDDEDGDED